MTRPHSSSILPARRPGARPARLSPNAYAERVPWLAREAPEVLDRTFWLATAPQEAVQHDGVKFSGRTYWSVDLVPLVSAGRRRHKPRLQVRYDAAKLAAGRLDELDLERFDPVTSQWQFVARCREQTLYRLEAEQSAQVAEELARTVAAHANRLTDERDAAEDVVQAKRTNDATAARIRSDRRSRAHSGRPVPARPPKPAEAIFADEKAVERQRQARLASLAGRVAPNRTGPGATTTGRVGRRAARGTPRSR